MTPKTFQVLLRRPFGHYTSQPFFFYLHAGTHREALDWVARVLEGLDVQSTLKHWANPPARTQVGTHLPVTVIDCDAFRPVSLEASCQARKSEAEVTENLRTLFDNLDAERKALTRAFEHYKRQYERDSLAQHMDRMKELKAYAEQALHWQARVWAKLLARLQHQALELPLERSGADCATLA